MTIPSPKLKGTTTVVCTHCGTLHFFVSTVLIQLLNKQSKVTGICRFCQTNLILKREELPSSRFHEYWYV
jgi:hypothetical protein